jgi:3-hydroxyisobutyrate dehydrogenase-like beta-hydroxyacid dehydrogenase
VTRFGFIGLGQMGHGMAASLLRGGLPLTVHDQNEAAGRDLVENGATWADSPGQVAKECDVLFTSLPTPAVVETVAYGPAGVVDSLQPGAAWFDLSTNALDVVTKLHADLRTRGIDFFDAPVSGGPAGAASGKLAIWVGGDAAAFQRHSPVLAHLADRATRIGGIGAGTTAKLLHNVASAAINAVTAEVMTVGVKAGIEPAALYEALRSGAAGRRRSFDAVGPRFLAGTFDPPSFKLQLAHKDLGLARRLAQDLRVPTRMCDLVFDEISEAMNRGWGERDSQTSLLLQQERAGIDPIAIPKDVLDGIRERT